MMTENAFEALLEQLRHASRLPVPAPQPPTGECLEIRRARDLVLQPERWLDAERRHLRGCRRCAHLVSTMAGEMPHLSTWILLRGGAGKLTLPEERARRFHLDEGGCRFCHSRSAALKVALPRMVCFSAGIALSSPGAAAAAMGTWDT